MSSLLLLHKARSPLCSERTTSLVVTRALVAPQVIGSTPLGENFVDSEAPMVTSSILRIFADPIFEDAPRGIVCMCSR
jgi:hypothetical protein